MTATVAATLIVSGLQHGWTTFRPERASPAMTSGGKFAARVEALQAAAESDALTIPTAPRVPLLAADTALQIVPIGFGLDGGSSDARAVVEPPRPAKHLARVEIRRRAPADQALDVVPPRRRDNVADVAVEAVPATDGVADGGVWTTTKGLYRQAVWFGGTVIDRVNPLNLLP